MGFESGYHERLGQFVPDQIKNITGSFANITDWNGTLLANGVFNIKEKRNVTTGGGYGIYYYSAAFDASRVVPTGERVQSRGFTAHWIIQCK